MKTRQKVRRVAIIGMFILLPGTLYYFSPVLSAAASGLVSGSVVVFALLFLSSLFFGRLFCGWACPVGGARAVDFFYQTRAGISVKDLPGIIAYASVLAVFFLLAVAVGKRAGCHTICWMAPFMVIGRSIRNVFACPRHVIRFSFSSGR